MTRWTDREREIVNFLSSASIEKIGQWLHERLHGTDSLGGSRDESPRSLVAHVYRLLGHGQRSDVQYAAHAALAEIAHTSSTWSEDAAAELLLLADPIFTETPPNTAQRAEITELLTRLAQPKSHRLEDRPGIRVAATQALLALDAKPTPRFWFHLYEEYGPPYAPLVVEALLRSDINALTTWMIEHLPDTALEDALLNLLPFMLQKHGSGITGNVIRQLLARLSAETREELTEIAADAAMDLGDTTPQVNVGMALSHALNTINHLLWPTAVAVNEVLRKELAGTLARTREALNEMSGIHPDRTWDLWGKYVDCADRAILHPGLVSLIVPELVSGLPHELVRELLLHLVSERGMLSEIFEELGELPTADISSDSTEWSTAMPPSLRGKLIVELSLVADERKLRDRLTDANIERLNELIGPFQE